MNIDPDRWTASAGKTLLEDVPPDKLVIAALDTASGTNHGKPEDKKKPAKPLPPIRDGVWIAENVQPTPTELVHNLLHMGCKMMLGGGSKSFKTWCLADLAISISSGVQWLGMETTQGVVAYLNFEIQESFFHFRLREIAAAKNVDLHKNLRVWNLRGHSAPAEIILPSLVKQLKDEGVVAVVVDPMYKLSPGVDENSAKEITLLMANFEQLAEETGAASIFGAHFSKGNQAAKESIDRISGSGVYARDPDCILTLTRHAEESAFTVDPILRNCPPMQPFAVRWEFPLIVLAPDLDPEDLKQIKAPASRRIYTADEVLTVLPVGTPTRTTEWLALASEELGIGKTKFYDLKIEIESKMRSRITINSGCYTRIS